jgi:hypothetical protein
MTKDRQGEKPPSVSRRTAIKSIAGMAGLGVGTLTLSETVSAGGFEYEIVNYHSDKVLTVAGRGNGKNVYQWDYNGGDNQLWFRNKQSDNSYTFENKHSGKFLEIAGWGTDNGDNVQQWEYHGGASQRWYPDSAGYENKHSGKFLEVADWGTDNGDNVQQWEYHGGGNQEWYLVRH